MVAVHKKLAATASSRNLLATTPSTKTRKEKSQANLLTAGQSPSSTMLLGNTSEFPEEGGAAATAEEGEAKQNRSNQPEIDAIPEEDKEDLTTAGEESNKPLELVPLPDVVPPSPDVDVIAVRDENAEGGKASEEKPIEEKPTGAKMEFSKSVRLKSSYL
jgi:hypothetical protein